MLDSSARAAQAPPSTTSAVLCRAPTLPRAAWIAFLVPAGLMLWSAYAVWVSYSPTPYVDQWVDLYWWRQAARTGWFDYMFSQRNEHRIFFPRLVFIADWKWFQGRDILNLVAVGLTQAIGAAFFIRCARPGRAGVIGLLGLAAAVTLLASLMQWETFFWGFCLQNAGVYASAAWALYAFCKASSEPRAVRWGWIAAAVALLTVATFNMANGVLAGLAMLLVAAVTRRGGIAAAAAAVATGVLLALYLHGYQAPARHDPPSVILHDPGPFIAFVGALIGNIWWTAGKIPQATIVGLAGCAATVAMLAVLARDRSRDPARAALAGVALFVGLTAAMTGLGRLHMGIEMSHSSRYMTATAYFWAAQAVFWTLTAERAASRIGAGILGTAAVLALLRLLALQSVGYDELLAKHDQFALATSVLLGGVEDDYAVLPVEVFADPKMVRDDVPFLRSRRMSLFADPPAAAVGTVFSRPLAPTESCRGAFDTLGPSPAPSGAPAVRHASGWGWDLSAHRAISRVVMVDGAGRVLGIGVSGVRRSDVAKAVREVHSPTSGWIASMNSGADREVIAYGILATGSACELGRKTWPL
jgi:hypothetical protein